MEILSLNFAILTIASIFIFYLLNHKYRTWFLLFLSTGFVISFSLNLLIYMVGYALMNYWLGIRIQKAENKKIWVRTGIVLNLLQLFLLKYASFAIDPLIKAFSGDFEVAQLSKIIVPVGISYFTVQGIGYLINIKMEWEKPETSFPKFLLYIIFYPKFLSGPVERSNHFLPQLEKNDRFIPENITDGLRTALVGYFKKMVVANHLAATVSLAYTSPESFGGYQLLIIILIQPLYLYFDFSGYTDIAIGIAKTFGIELLPNFKRPFQAENVTNFWKRFHMSLSSWFNDYVFKQTSFRLRRLKEKATTIAVFLTWLLFGIWHGAGWNFMVLGLMQALAIYYEFKTRKKRIEIFSKMPQALAKWTGRIVTYCFYGVSLSFFFSPDLKTTIAFLSGITGRQSFEAGFMAPGALLAGLLFALPFLVFEVIQNDHEKFSGRLITLWTGNKKLRLVVYYLAAFLLLTQLNKNSTFIYEIF